MRPARRAHASSAPGRGRPGNLKPPKAATRSASAPRPPGADGQPPVCASSSTSTIAGTTGLPGKWP